MTRSEATAESAGLRNFRAAFEEFVAAFDARDFERAATGMADDYEQHFPPGFTQRVLYGRDAWIKFFEEYVQDVEEWRITPREFIEAEPGTFVVAIDYVGVGRASGLRGDLHVWDVIDLDDEGRVRRVREFYEREEALAAAGIDDRGGR